MASACAGSSTQTRAGPVEPTRRARESLESSTEVAEAWRIGAQPPGGYPGTAGRQGRAGLRAVARQVAAPGGRAGGDAAARGAGGPWELGRVAGELSGRGRTRPGGFAGWGGG